MAMVSDHFHKNKLKKYNINIKTKYIVGNKILERNTNDSYNDDIKNGIRCEKQYFISDQLVHIEKVFDSRIEYTFISKQLENGNFSCPNCGISSKLRNFADGCPYCRTHYNIDYIDKDLGSKYHYDRVLKKTTYRFATAVIDFVISLFLSYIFIKKTSRTFNSYDITKIFIYAMILSLILYYFFYIIDGYIVLGPIKRYKDKQNKKQIDFWNRTKIDKKTFFNNFNYEVRKRYYSSSDIIDYDILDFLSFKEQVRNHILYVQVKADVRVVYYNGHKIVSKNFQNTYLMKKVNEESFPLVPGVNIISCPNCGSSIDVTKGFCEYCHTKIKCLQEWVIE